MWIKSRDYLERQILAMMSIRNLSHDYTRACACTHADTQINHDYDSNAAVWGQSVVNFISTSRAKQNSSRLYTAFETPRAYMVNTMQSMQL